MSWKLSSPDSFLYYFQDWKACTIELWIMYENGPLVQAPAAVHVLARRSSLVTLRGWRLTPVQRLQVK